MRENKTEIFELIRILDSRIRTGILLICQGRRAHRLTPEYVQCPRCRNDRIELRRYEDKAIFDRDEATVLGESATYLGE